MPIPSFQVYNGFETDFDAITVYNRVSALDNQRDQNIVALSAFLRGFMTSRNQRDSNTYSASQVFMASSPPTARVWGVQKLLNYFPALKPKREANKTPTPNAVLMAALLKSLIPQASSSSISPATKTANF